MIRVSFDVSIPDTNKYPVLQICSMLAVALEQEAVDGMVIHNLTVEEADA